MTAFYSARYTLFMVSQEASKWKTLPVEEIAVEFVHPRQQEMKTFSSERR